MSLLLPQASRPEEATTRIDTRATRTSRTRLVCIHMHMYMPVRTASSPACIRGSNGQSFSAAVAATAARRLLQIPRPSTRAPHSFSSLNL